jgi:putative nucleotidyltransferase with HDIG domain
MTETLPLVDIIQQHLASEQLQLPVFPPLAAELQQMLTQEDCNINHVAAKIMEDQALASHLLRLANSAFFSGLSKVATVKDAIMRLGIKQVTNLVLLVTQGRQYRTTSKLMGLYSKSLWQHAVGCALGTKWLAERLGHKHLAQEAFLAGLLHDVGKLFLLQVLDDLQGSGEYNLSLSKVTVLEVMSNLHAEHGARLLQQWNLPELYCDVARQHHDESVDGDHCILMLVRLVNLACHKLGIGTDQSPTVVLATTLEAQHLEASELLLAELEIMLEDASALAT